MREKDNVLSAYDNCQTHAEWIRRVAEALGMYYDYDGPFVAAEADAVVDYINELKSNLHRLEEAAQ